MLAAAAAQRAASTVWLLPESVRALTCDSWAVTTLGDGCASTASRASIGLRSSTSRPCCRVVYALHLGRGFKHRHRARDRGAHVRGLCHRGGLLRRPVDACSCGGKAPPLTSASSSSGRRLVQPWHARTGEAEERTAAETEKLRRGRPLMRACATSSSRCSAGCCCSRAPPSGSTARAPSTSCDMGLPGTEAFDRSQFLRLDWASLSAPWFILAAFGIKAAFPVPPRLAARTPTQSRHRHQGPCG